eukprot:gene19015-20927_t
MSLLTALKILRFAAMALVVAVGFSIVKSLLVFKLDMFTDYIVKFMENLSTIPKEDFESSMCGMEMYKCVLKMLWREAFISMQKGSSLKEGNLKLSSVFPEPNESAQRPSKLPQTDVNGNQCEVEDISVNADREGRIVDLAELGKRNVPLMEEFSKIVAEFSDIADFVVVYVEEAHPVDEWCFKNAQFSMKQQSRLEERVEAARYIATKYQHIPVYADLMNNNVSKAFGALPERLYILLNNQVVYAGGIGPFAYDLEEMQHCLVQYTDNLNNNNDNNNNKLL